MNEQQVAYRLRSELDLQLALSQLPHADWLADVDETQRSRLCTIAAELGSNMVKFARSGDLSVRRCRNDREDLVEILAVDAGPGIADVPAAVREHFSTAGTLGLGLPGVLRMADQVHIETGLGWGTRVQARTWLRDRPAARSRLTYSRREGHEPVALPLQWGAEIRPYPGQRQSGDAAAFLPLTNGRLLAVMLDASGHGPRANELVTRLLAVVQRQASGEIPLLLEALHGACRGTSGAAAGAAVIDPVARTLSYAGVGNVRARLVGPANGQQAWSGVSRDGVLGDRFPTPFVQQQLISEGQVLLLYSDGVSESLRSFRGSLPGASQAAALAWQVVDQCGRTTDDAACAVVRCG